MEMEGTGSAPPSLPPSLPPSDDESDEQELLGAVAEEYLANLKAELSGHPAFVQLLSYQRQICESLLRHLPSRLVIPDV